MIDRYNVTNQNDINLKEATNELYKLEHAKGVMDKDTGVYQGLSVSEARDEIIKLLTNEGKGDILI